MSQYSVQQPGLSQPGGAGGLGTAFGLPGAQGSFGAAGGAGTQQQLGFSGGGVITYDFDAPLAGSYRLSALTVTVQDNPDLLLEVNQDKNPVAIPLPCTVGAWRHTEPVLINLVKGRNSLRFIRPAGSRGLSIREVSLRPAATTTQTHR